MGFWILWGFDTIIALIFGYFFLIGLADGSVSSFNIGLWMAILFILGAVLWGSLALRATERTGLAKTLLLLLAVPGLLFGLFFLVILIAQPRWN